jgi:hypothetical protein
MSLPVIVASETSTNEPEEVVVFNKWWIESLNITGSQDGVLSGLAVLTKFGTKQDQSMVFNGEKTVIHIENILQEAIQNETLSSVIGGIIQYVGQKAIEKGCATEIQS